MPVAPSPRVRTSPASTEAAGPSGLPRLSLMMGWWSLVSAMFYIYIAALVASIVGFTEAIIGLVLTTVIFGVINKVLSAYAIDTGLNVEQLSRVFFGKVGSILATAVFAATALYYGVFEGSVVAATLESYTRDTLGWSINVWYLVVVVYSTPLVFGGVRGWLDRLNGALLPLYTIGLVAAVVVAAVKGSPSGWTGFGGHPHLSLSVGGPGWLFAVATYMGVWILMMYTVDFARLGRTKDRRFHSTITFGPVFYALAFLANGLVGIFLTHTLRGTVGSQISEGGVAVALTQLMGIWAVLLVWISQTRINTANYYLASINLESLGNTLLRTRIPRTAWVVVGSIIMYVLMRTNVFTYILTALNWQATLITGWVAIALVHIGLERRARHPQQPTPTAQVPVVAVPGVVAWVIASVVGLTLLEVGPAWSVTWGPILTAVVAASTYVLLRSVRRSAPDVTAMPADV